MSCWQQLGISPTEDKRNIKKAYAALLKCNKPDENPEGFSRIHAAYKECLYHASKLSANVQQSEQATNESTISGVSEDLEITQQAVSTEQIGSPANEELAASEQAEDLHLNVVIDASAYLTEEDNQEYNLDEHFNTLNVSWEKIVEDSNKALEQFIKNDDINNWVFLQECIELYDFQFKTQYTYHLFESLLNVFEKNEKLKPEKRVATLHYISSQLNWLDMYSSFEHEFGEEKTSVIFNVLFDERSHSERKLVWVVPKIHHGPIELANYYARLAAKFIDLVLFYMLIDTILPVFNPHAPDGESLIYTILVYLLLTPILEASPMQGSIGKVLFGMKATSRQGKRLNILHSFYRQIIFLLNMAGFKVVIWINALAMRDGYLLHDKLSLSRVIKRY